MRQDACKAGKGRKRQKESVKRTRGLRKTCSIRQRRKGQDRVGKAVMPQEREARGTRASSGLYFLQQTPMSYKINVNNFLLRLCQFKLQIQLGTLRKWRFPPYTAFPLDLGCSL